MWDVISGDEVLTNEEATPLLSFESACLELLLHMSTMESPPGTEVSFCSPVGLATKEVVLSNSTFYSNEFVRGANVDSVLLFKLLCLKSCMKERLNQTTKQMRCKSCCSFYPGARRSNHDKSGIALIQ